MVNVLFVCIGNACRSQMAEGLANHLGGGAIRAYSAGSHALGEIAPDTYEVMRERGIALDNHWSKDLDDVPLPEMNIVVEMGHGVECPIPEGFKGRVIEWNIPDPYGHDREIYRGVLHMIEAEVRGLLADLAGDSGSSKPVTGESDPSAEGSRC